MSRFLSSILTAAIAISAATAEAHPKKRQARKTLVTRSQKPDLSKIIQSDNSLPPGACSFYIVGTDYSSSTLSINDQWVEQVPTRLIGADVRKQVCGQTLYFNQNGAQILGIAVFPELTGEKLFSDGSKIMYQQVKGKDVGSISITRVVLLPQASQVAIASATTSAPPRVSRPSELHK